MSILFPVNTFSNYFISGTFVRIFSLFSPFCYFRSRMTPDTFFRYHLPEIYFWIIYLLYNVVLHVFLGCKKKALRTFVLFPVVTLAVIIFYIFFLKFLLNFRFYVLSTFINLHGGILLSSTKKDFSCWNKGRSSLEDDSDHFGVWNDAAVMFYWLSISR